MLFVAQINGQNAWCGSDNDYRFVGKELISPIKKRAVLTIPIVFHIVWKDSVENISDERIFSQLDVLNTDFRKLNSNLSFLPESLQNLAADMEIEFCLAGENEQGKPTKGIVRKQTNIENIGTQNTVSLPSKAFIKNSALGGSDAWNPDKYLNVWIGKFQESGILAESKFPWDTLKSEDGIRIDPEYVGVHCIDAFKKKYAYGRTLTHEIGHYLGLLHPWSADCTTGDFIDDTPPQRYAYYGCPQNETDECSQRPLFENYMQFTDDRCMALFTNDQKQRVSQMLATYRPKLLENNIGCFQIYYDNPFDNESLKLYPNPTTACVMISTTSNRNEEIGIEIFDAAGKLVYKARPTVLQVRPIEIEQLQAGMYVVRFENKGNYFYRKLVVL